MNRNIEKERKLHIIGWVLFIVCAFFFLASGIRDNDHLTLIGSLVFLVACVVFLVPLVGGKKK